MEKSQKQKKCLPESNGPSVWWRALKQFSALRMNTLPAPRIPPRGASFPPVCVKPVPWYRIPACRTAIAPHFRIHGHPQSGPQRPARAGRGR